MYNYNQYAKTYPQYFMLHKGLPKGYTQQKYITANRNQYIDTELSIEVGDKINVQCEPLLGKAGVIFTVFGAGEGQVVISTSQGFRGVKHIGVEVVGQNPFIVTGTALEGINGLLALCRAFTNNKPVFEGDIYNLNVMRDNQIIMNLTPCLDDKGVPCLYDIINEKTYYSSSSTPFLKGE